MIPAKVYGLKAVLRLFWSQGRRSISSLGCLTPTASGGITFRCTGLPLRGSDH
jgi:hypothetical protein